VDATACVELGPRICVDGMRGDLSRGMDGVHASFRGRVLICIPAFGESAVVAMGSHSGDDMG
jgi:hypothetical protein